MNQNSIVLLLFALGHAFLTTEDVPHIAPPRELKKEGKLNRNMALTKLLQSIKHDEPSRRSVAGEAAADEEDFENLLEESFHSTDYGVSEEKALDEELAVGGKPFAVLENLLKKHRDRVPIHRTTTTTTTTTTTPTTTTTATTTVIVTIQAAREIPTTLASYAQTLTAPEFCPQSPIIIQPPPIVIPQPPIPCSMLGQSAASAEATDVQGFVLGSQPFSHYVKGLQQQLRDELTKHLG